MIGRRFRWAALGMAALVLLVWTSARAEHSVTFSQTNTSGGGIAIRGVATGGFSGHPPVGVLARAANGRGVVAEGFTGIQATGVWTAIDGEATNVADGIVMGVRGVSRGRQGRGVSGYAASPSGITFGVYGSVASAGGYGVYGVGGYTGVFGGGTQRGVSGSTSGAAGVGVSGYASHGTGTTYGVQGTAASWNGTGVYGRATSSMGTTFGLHGISDSTGGTGIRGIATAVSGFAHGVYGQSSSTSGIGVRGHASAASGETLGVYGAVSSTAGTGVLGRANALSGTTFGVRGEASSPDGAAVMGVANNGADAGRFKGDVRIVSGGHLYVHGDHVADLAEDMPLHGRVWPGDVVSLVSTGYAVQRTARAYDTGVAGIVSSEPRLHFGVGRGLRKAPVAMVGVVRARATAANGAIRPRDLLTTSSVPGHLMRCPRPVLCIGAIVGKALEPLVKGRGQILVLIWRQ